MGLKPQTKSEEQGIHTQNVSQRSLNTEENRATLTSMCLRVRAKVTNARTDKRTMHVSSQDARKRTM